MKCAALYNHTNLRSNNKIYPCCRYKTPIQEFDGNVDKILHSEEYNQLRETFSIDNPNCAKCKHEESLGKESLRQWFNDHYSTEKIELKYFEVGFDNICNLTCDGCWEEWSHSWFIKKNPIANLKDGINQASELSNIPSSIEKIVFLGGEPLMTNRHYRFLQTFDTLEMLEVEYFTNGTHPLPADHIELLKKCKHVKFTISIDGYKTLNETTRSGSKWTDILNFLYLLPDKFEKVIHTTIHINNWHGLTDLSEWCIKNQYNWTTNVLTYPKNLDIINLSNEMKSKLLDILELYNIPNKEYIKAHLLRIKYEN